MIYIKTSVNKNSFRIKILTHIYLCIIKVEFYITKNGIIDKKYGVDWSPFETELQKTIFFLIIMQF